jgi:hypothetical protein
VPAVTCPQCLEANPDRAIYCGTCGTLLRVAPAAAAFPADPDITVVDARVGAPVTPGPGPGWPGEFQFGEPAFGASASQFPATPADQYVPVEVAGQHPPGPADSASEFRLNLRRLSRAEQVTGAASMIVLVALFLPWFGFSELGASITVSGTTAHSYLVVVVITALLMTGYLLLRCGWDELPVRLPVAPEVLLLVGAGVQLALVLFGFLDMPLSGLGWEIGAYLALIAAVAAAVPLTPVALGPALHLWQSRAQAAPCWPTRWRTRAAGVRPESSAHSRVR